MVTTAATTAHKAWNIQMSTEPMKVFFSWQADASQAVCRDFIREAIEEALNRIGAELGLEDAERPEVDHDTKNRTGWVQINNKILDKIAHCAAFVADVTTVAQTPHQSKEVPNPNVMMELGCALSEVGEERIVVLTNTAFGSGRPEKLPFNMRHRVAPAAYRLKKDATPEQTADAKEDLVDQLVDWLGSSLREAMTAKPPAEGKWHAASPGDPALWASKDGTFAYRNMRGSGTTTPVFDTGARAYMRLLPSGWRKGPPPREILQDEDNGRNFIPLGHTSGALAFGLNGDGFLCHTGIKPTPSIAQYFQDSGEIWGATTLGVHQGPTHRYLAPAKTIGYFSWFLTCSLAILRHHGAHLPIYLRFGMTELSGTVISGLEGQPDNIDGDFVIQEALTGWTVAEQLRVLHAAYNKMRHTYGVKEAPLTATQSMAEGWLKEPKA